MTDIAIQKGIRGTRQLAAAFAAVSLRRRNLPNRYRPWSERDRRDWRPDELKRALELRAMGKTFVQIGAAIGRNKGSVHAKIGRRAA